MIQSRNSATATAEGNQGPRAVNPLIRFASGTLLMPRRRRA